MTIRKKVEIWTDGACSGNPGPGGFGVILQYGPKRKEISGGFNHTTNNRMELMGVIAGLSALKDPCDVTLHSDSKYIVEAMQKGWPQAWQKKGWRKKDGMAKNTDLWEQILDLCEKHKVEFSWLKGHSGHDENERCDELARQAFLDGNLEEDGGFSG
jgi:ribonuclease HI